MKFWLRSYIYKSSFQCTLFVGILCACAINCFALDREAFTFTNYNLTVQLDPEQHRLGVRGRLTLRNDSSTPQKTAVLQISSSLDWRAIKTGDKAVPFLTQPYTSDIDHTGALTEAIVTLPQPVAPHATVDLTIAYEGVILLDATRLTRIGTPDNAANSSDWDQISTTFTAVRGAGYVAWYPIATESANLSEGNSLFEILGKWKKREADAGMTILFESNLDAPILFSGNRGLATVAVAEGIVKIGEFSMLHMGTNVPTFASGNYKKLDMKGSSVAYLSDKETAAQSYVDLVGQLDPLPESHGKRDIQVVELPDSSAAPFATEGMLLMPLKATPAEPDRLTLVYALAREEARSTHPWISEGLAHLAQVIDIEHQHGRPAALAYLQAHQSMLVDLEKHFSLPESVHPKEDTRTAAQSLLETKDEVYLQNKAMWVWSMLRDMVGLSLDIVLSSYHATDDRSSSYMEELFAKHTQRSDLQWFFDDWVYHDRGLPDFKIDSAFPVKTPTNSYIITVTVTNLGGAGAEVPIIVKSAAGDAVKRLEVRARSKAVTRIEVPGAPQEIIVNDGSVPESDTTNNVFKMEAASTSHENAPPK
jgi:hypothetical protein